MTDSDKPSELLPCVNEQCGMWIVEDNELNCLLVYNGDNPCTTKYTATRPAAKVGIDIKGSEIAPVFLNLAKRVTPELLTKAGLMPIPVHCDKCGDGGRAQIDFDFCQEQDGCFLCKWFDLNDRCTRPYEDCPCTKDPHSAYNMKEKI